MINKWARYSWTKFNKVAQLHDMENLCQVIARRLGLDTLSGERLGYLFIYSDSESPKSVAKRVEPMV